MKNSHLDISENSATCCEHTKTNKYLKNGSQTKDSSNPLISNKSANNQESQLYARNNELENEKVKHTLQSECDKNTDSEITSYGDIDLGFCLDSKR